MRLGKHSSLELCGVIHLQPLPGSYRAAQVYRRQRLEYHRQVDRILTRALQEARILEKTGFDSIIVENFGDVPFVKESVSPETVSALAIIVNQLRKQIKIPIGVNVLRNDAHSALSIASVAGASFVRVNVLSGVAATDQGWIEGRASEVLVHREKLDPSLRILADVWVKHARQFSSQNLSQSIEETFLRAGADGVILTGATTGRAPEQDYLAEAVDCCERLKVPLYIGSGVSVKTIVQIPQRGISGIIVGSDLRRDGIAGNPLEARRASSWIRNARKHFKSS